MLSFVAAGLLFFSPGIPKKTDMETRVLAITASHGDEQPDSLHENQLLRITFNRKPLTSH
jgi:hypothetical protein